MSSLKIYRMMDRVFPKSYLLKMLSISFVGVHIPLISAVVYMMATNSAQNSGELLILLIAGTAVGTLAACSGIWAVMAPIELATLALTAYRDSRRTIELDGSFQDCAGRLMGGVHALLLEMDRAFDEIKRLAVCDPLTGLLNRRGFEQLFNEKMSQASNLRRLTIAIMDLDHFKHINDEFGHPKGDEVLKIVAEVLRASCQVGDLIARYGGEEFLLLFADRDPLEVAAICERIRQRIAGRPILPRRVTVSIGVAALHAGESWAELITRADHALYLAKKSGRNQMQFNHFVARAA